MPTTLSKTPHAPRASAPNPNEERPENCYCSALPRVDNRGARQMYVRLAPRSGAKADIS